MVTEYEKIKRKLENQDISIDDNGESTRAGSSKHSRRSSRASTENGNADKDKMPDGLSADEEKKWKEEQLIKTKRALLNASISKCKALANFMSNEVSSETHYITKIIEHEYPHSNKQFVSEKAKECRGMAETLRKHVFRALTGLDYHSIRCNISTEIREFFDICKNVRKHSIS